MNNNPAELTTGSTISPLDGRYFFKIKNLSDYFSEKALNKYRLRVEVEYLVKLSSFKICNGLTASQVKALKKIYLNFNDDDLKTIKKIEEKINHDVKAIEYFLRRKLEKINLKELIPFIHFGLTSEDTNNLAYGLILKEFKEKILEKEIYLLIDYLKLTAKKYKKIPMLGRTHGQPAVGSTIGKELANYVYRLKKQSERLKKFKFEGKCGGAVGNHNALKTVLPEKDWLKFSKELVESFGLTTNFYATQILFYDNQIEFFQIIKTINGILIDMAKNIWIYIMLNFFFQKKKGEEVGSSTMPQKVNPINFEQAEGSLGLANSMINYFEQKLIESRLQRDLSDSIVRRVFGEAMAYTILGWQNIFFGFKKIDVNKNQLKSELNNHWEILTEAIQTSLRLKKDNQAYEKMKSLTRGKTINKKEYFKLLKALGLENDKKLKDLTPEKYIGYAVKLVDKL
jgi:adenylosuccinate lyase